MLKADICNRCQCELDDTNWYPSASKRRWLICKDCERKRQAVYRSENPRVVYNQNCRKKYGIEYDEFISIFNSQGNVCAICKSSNSGRKGKKMCIDHCHTTGLVRGILCHKCNVAIGLFNDDIQTIQNAKDYLCK